MQAPYSVFQNLFPGYTQSMDWTARLTEKFNATGWSKTELARRADVSYDNVLKYLAGGVKQPRGDIMGKLAKALGTTEAWLRGFDHPELTMAKGGFGNVQPVKVTGYVKAGIWQDARVEGPSMDVPSIGGYPVDMQTAYVVDGESLNKIARNGDVLVCLDLIESGVSIKDNDLVIVELMKHDGEFVDRSAKRVRRTRTGFELWPESDHPDHQEPLVLNDVEDGIDMRVSAKVLWIIRKP